VPEEKSYLEDYWPIKAKNLFHMHLCLLEVLKARGYYKAVAFKILDVGLLVKQRPYE